jgi:AAA+ superfamily predicted ATPase/CheY-specific phosphatase CheX
MPTPAAVESLAELLATRTPIVVIETHDERRVMALVGLVAQRNGREVWQWSASRGLRVAHNLKLELADLDGGKHADAAATQELPQALAAAEKLKGNTLVMFLDIHPYLSNPVIARGMKELALKAESKGVQLLFVGHDVRLPDELAPYASRFELEPMTLERVKALFNEETQARRQRSAADLQGERSVLDSLLRHLVGLPEPAVRHIVRLALGDGRINTADLARALAVKQETMGAAELLVFESKLPTMDQVAGMTALKRWLLLRREPFVNGAASGLPPPRGVLLLGVQGAGKSLAAKAIAASWQVPLFRMDFGALFDKYQGESERKLREALRVADAMQPCVLWMDEVEKGLASGGGDGDTGAGKRMLGTLLTWMAERKSAVFLVATANDIEALPPELMRKGRFDEIFFVDLPDAATRAAIFRIHLDKHAIAADAGGLDTLAGASEGFAGAEIEAAVIAARYEAHGRAESAGLAHVRAELARTKPLSVTRAEAIAALRQWAAGRTVSAE